MEPDLNQYDLFHVTTRHPRMTDAELLGIYRKAWELYYTPEHVETVLRRAQHWGYDPHNMMWKLLSFHAAPLLENVHPMEGGIFRRKFRQDRRYGLPLAPPLVFHARYAWEILSKYARFLPIYLRYRRTLKRVKRDHRPYTDVAMTPVDAIEFERLELFQSTEAARTGNCRTTRSPTPSACTPCSST